MKDKFKYEIWNLPSYIMALKNTSRKLTNDDLKNISGGAMERKLTASVLAGLSVLVGGTNFIKTDVNATSPTLIAKSESKKQNIDFEISKEQAIEDINYVLKIIKDNHVSSVENIPDEVTDQAKTEIEKFNDKVNVIDEWRAISRILAKLHDAHTRVIPPRFLNKRLPFDTEYNCGKIICKGGDFDGCELTAINGISISDLYRIFQSHFSYEIDEWTEHNFYETPSSFIPEWKLALCGIGTSKPIKADFKVGSEIQSRYFDMSKITTQNTNSEHWVSFKIDEENSLGIFNLNQCEYNEEYASTLVKFFQDVSEKKIKNIAIDLRKNSGGNSAAALSFALGLKKLKKFRKFDVCVRTENKISKINSELISKDEIERFRTNYLGENYDKNILFDGNVFLLTSHGSFSAAMHFATLFSDNNCAKIIGEIPGNSPESFGDTLGKSFYTPNSNLKFCTTFKKFYRPDKNKDSTKLIPDIQISAKDALKKVCEIIDEDRSSQ